MHGTMAKEPKKPKPAANPWPEKLRALRDILHLTQVEAAAQADIPTRTWIAWENDQRRPGRMALKLLLQAFPQLQ